MDIIFNIKPIWLLSVQLSLRRELGNCSVLISRLDAFNLFQQISFHWTAKQKSANYDAMFGKQNSVRYIRVAVNIPGLFQENALKIQEKQIETKVNKTTLFVRADEFRLKGKKIM